MSSFRPYVKDGLLASVALMLALASNVNADEREAFFERHIRPALITHCYECHSNAHGKSEGGLLLDSRPALQRGGDSGAAIKAGSPSESLLIEAIRYESLEMPPGKQLDKKTIALFEEWIQQGAVDPRVEETTIARTLGIDLDEARKFWAFQPRSKTATPATVDWGSSPIDRFIWRKLDEHKLRPNQEADRSTWLRRVTFDLIGLPPAVEELESFLADQTASAYERVVDRLLASSRYGERWGRYWLDLARYADSNGADENHKYPAAWRYRDYVVSAFNADKPYDRMIMEQLAGDLLPAESESERRDNLTATGFLLLGPKMLAEQDKEKLVADIVDEQLDTFGKVFLGLTLGCARCHDHKFDPISAEDYYSLAGVFHSTKTMEHLNHVSQWNERELPDQIREREIAQNSKPLHLAEAEANTLDTELRDFEFERKMSILSALMLQELGDAKASSFEAGTQAAKDEFDSEKQSQLLQVFLDDTVIFRVWQELHQAPEDQFEQLAEQRWRALASQPPKEKRRSAAHSFELRLAAQPVPQTVSELVTAYVAALRRCGEEAQQRGPDHDLWDHLFSRNAVLDRTRWTPTWVTKSQKKRADELKKRIAELKKDLPKLDKVMAADDAEVKLVSLHVRGDHLQLSGDPLPREVPRVLASPSPTEFPSDSSGRLELARWLTHPDHPLTARVMVNRIWQGHFGFGLVRSPSNFGIRGEKPTHPELLDWLADEFVRSDWSIKRMHRMIVLSSTYRMSSAASSEATTVDPENEFLSHFPRRRLELEPIRDSLLAIADQLDGQLGGETKLKQGSKYMSSDVDKTVFDARRRTMYIPINRAALNAVFSTFDYVDPATSLEQRPTTTVPHQTLFLMNHPLVMDVGQQLAARIIADATHTAERTDLVYKITFARSPTPEESHIAERFISDKTRGIAGETSNAELAAWTSYCRSLLLTNEFLYVE